MGRLATKRDFEGGRLYDNYRRYPFFAQRADWIVDHYPVARTVLVAGCGYGFLVDELLARGVDAWGFDASAYAVGRANAQLPERGAKRVLLGDARDFDARTEFDLVVSEDLLPCADDEAEARAWIAHLRTLGTTVVHLVTPAPERPVVDLLWLTIDQWRALCAPDAVLNVEDPV